LGCLKKAEGKLIIFFKLLHYFF